MATKGTSVLLCIKSQYPLPKYSNSKCHSREGSNKRERTRHAPKEMENRGGKEAAGD